VNKDNVIPTDQELTALIIESRRDKTLDCVMGTGRLINLPSNDWAFKRIEEMRAKTIEIGEGV
jgi:hypothetical protein